MTKIFSVSNHGVPDGYGRIVDETFTRLWRRQYDIFAASLSYDGLLPATYSGRQLPYHVAALAGKPNWVEAVMQLINVIQPDVIVVTQDAPYAQALRFAPIDWSKYGFIVITPVDGAPIYPQWVDVIKQADAALTISEFGVDAYRKQGVEVGLCRPAANLDSFFRLNDDQRKTLRERAGIAPDAFVLGTAAQNQGRKDIPAMMQGFFEFAKDKPTARYIMDMDKVSPAGWDLPALCQQFGWDASKILFREDFHRMGIFELRERYNLMDAHAVLSHREGWGLPLVEAQACGVVSMAMDYCSGTEICGNGKGVLVKPVDYTSVSTWGGALDYHPDVKHFTEQLQWLYKNPEERAAMAKRGQEWARSFTWDMAADSVQAAIEKVVAKRKGVVQAAPAPVVLPSVPQARPDGMNMETVPLLEAS